MAGFDTDVIRLAHAIGNAYRADPTNQQLAHLKIIAGDAVGTNLILGQGNGPDAAIAKNYPEDMARLIFSAFANPEEWSFEKVPPDQQPSFFNDWFNIYATSLQNTSTSFPGDHAMLTYDAVRVISDATMLVHGPLTGDAIRQALTLIGKGNIPAFQGVSGLIAFDGQGNPMNKVVVILEVDLIDSKAEVVLKEVLGNFR
jgi:ABC-type branched-subunit amino acid transport system substrate-binding protein